ncbi:MAG TPA: helix-turn-helix transcriptional regulator [Candidatus Limiplasma sp.]|nr:helix-turn-helix transcriptional regulator [Candidatus Limiplasma sp.]HRX07674.1 helix-turn-helix transcriptional regulator [Candidatus Limiplasma sp.]
MFDMQHVAKTISNLRKQSNLTQMELADKLGISFQAVSNWERGQTMPDIAKLSELSEIFGVSIDDLLGNGKSTKVVEKLIHEEPMDEDLSTEDFLDVAPLVKPMQAEKLFESVREKLSMKELILAAPFLHEKTLDAMAIDAARREKSFASMIGLLPFISRDAIDQCLQFVIQDGIEIKKLIMAAPFLGKKNVTDLADKILEKGTIKDLIALAPFMKKKKITEIAMQFAQKEGFTGILPLLPFMDKDELNTMFQHGGDDEE